MANRFNFPRETALDSNGAPLSGAQLHFYEAGTTKPANVYGDAALTVPSTNPVVADSAGRFGDIFLQAIEYKVVLADSDGVAVWSADPVSGTLDATGDDFAPSQQSPADMTVLVGGGSLFDAVSRSVIVRAPQSTPLIAAPVSNPRYDIVHIGRRTGAVGVATGAEAPAPADPAVPAGALPVARVRLQTTTVEITAVQLDDIRQLELLGAGGAAARETGTADGQVPVMDAVGYPPANGSQISNVPVPRGYIDGLILANNGLDPANDIDIAAGIARDDANAVNLELSSTLVKQLDAPWAEGSDQGGLDVGAKAANTWYHVWLIRRGDTGNVDALLSTSATTPAMPAGYTWKRRIGAVLTDVAGSIVAFTQDGDCYEWVTPRPDISLSNGVSTNSRLDVVSVPTGLGINAHVQVAGSDGATGWAVLVTGPDSSDAPAGSGDNCTISGSTDFDSSTLWVQTNTLSQIRSRANVATIDSYNVRTIGWIDRRGKNT